MTPQPSAGARTYRDATYSAATQELLRELLAELTIRPGWNADPRVHALGEVVERWDANEATECELS